ncbi:secY protein transport family protein isoform X2 [Wolffia australiana]
MATRPSCGAVEQFSVRGRPWPCSRGGLLGAHSARKMKWRSSESFNSIIYQQRGLILPTDRILGRNGRIFVQCSSNGSSISLSSPSPDADLTVTNLNPLTRPEEKDDDEFKAAKLRFHNRFLVFARIGSVINEMAESFFKSEIRRRLFVTALLILVSRIGYFVPLPGFDRRLIPQDYLTFASGSMDELGDFSAEMKLSFFQLGISPQIGASIVMQVLCHIVPSLVKLRKEGLDAQEKIKGYIWWLSLGFAMLESLIVAYSSLPYSIYAASYRLRHVAVTSGLLVLGAMTMTWICDTISESGFGHGSSLIICAGILTGYTDTLYKMFSHLTGSGISSLYYILAIVGVFTIVTMWAVVVTEGCRKVKLQYYAFKLASNSSILGSRFWENVRDILNPETSLGAEPWVFYAIYAFFVFLFNIFDIANLPKEISDYLTKMGARIPNVKPGKATIEYLRMVQASTRFWGGLLLSFLATSSIVLDYHLRKINQGFSIGFTSVLIIVGSIIELRRSYQAYNVMPSLNKILRRYGA